MKTLRTREGPFIERPYYSIDEIERTCVDELRAVDLMPANPAPIRIDRFIEKRFQLSHEYDDLPVGVLGYTRFSEKGVAGIVVSRSLEDEGSVTAERRVRSTLAHEAGHGLLHAHLFVLECGQSALFPDGSGPVPKVLCRGEKDAAAARAYKGEWWEFQANRAIGALLLPRHLALAALEQFTAANGGLGLRSLPEENRRDAVEHLATEFEVNPAVAIIRLEDLFPVSQVAQQELYFFDFGVSSVC